MMFQNGCGDSFVKEKETPDNFIGCTQAFQENCDVVLLNIRIVKPKNVNRTNGKLNK